MINWQQRKRNKEQQRQAATLVPHMKSLIPTDQIKDFMFTERDYCATEENDFYNCDPDDIDQKEHLRTMVLEKRKEFLQWWVKVNC